MASAGRPDNVRATIEELLDGLEELTVEQTLLLAELWSEEDDTLRRRAWQRAKAAIGRRGLEDVLDRARREVGLWMLAGPSDYQGIGGLLGRASDEVSLRRLAAPAVLDAVAGLLAQPDVHGEDADVLLRPWHGSQAAGLPGAEPDAGH